MVVGLGGKESFYYFNLDGGDFFFFFLNIYTVIYICPKPLNLIIRPLYTLYGYICMYGKSKLQRYIICTL